MPDVAPKFFCGHGSPNMTDPTSLHTDLADAVNLCLYATKSTEAEMEELRKMAQYDITTTNIHDQDREAGALWHIFHREAYEDVAR